MWIINQIVAQDENVSFGYNILQRKSFWGLVNLAEQPAGYPQGYVTKSTYLGRLWRHMSLCP